jgi:hypothetical protein
LNDFDLGIRTLIGPLDIWALHGNIKTQGQRNLLRPHEVPLRFSELESPVTSRINVQNDGDIFVFLEEGLLLDGLRQSRMLTEDVVLPPHSSQTIKTLCVEANRWGHERGTLLQGRAPISIIASARMHDSPAEKQSSVWRSVTRIESRTMTSQTNSLTTSLQSMNSFESEEIFSGYKIYAGQTGVLIGVHGSPLILEIYASEELFRGAFQEIIKSVLIETDGSFYREVNDTEIRKFFNHVSEIPSTQTSEIHSLVINQLNPIFV